MKDFIYELYQNDNFTLWLTIALVVLIILFVIVFFFGKKDEKLEETKRLQKIEIDSFKKKEETPTKLEVEQKPEEIKTEPEVKEAPKVNEEVTVTEFTPIIKEDEDEIELPKQAPAVKPIFKDHEEEESPISINELPLLAQDDKDKELEGKLNSLEAIKNEFDSIDIPKAKEEEKPIFKPSPQIFSSVFVNKEETVTKLEPEKEEEPNKTSNIFIIEDDEENMELPALKKEETKPLINDEKKESQGLFNDVSGEVYELK